MEKSLEPPGLIRATGNSWEELAERGVKALEALAKDPIVEIEAGPPICPACGYFNPVVSVSESNTQGAIFEFVLLATCTHCGVKFYAVPETWRMYLRREEVEMEMQERRGSGNRS
jgi:hypothetical protein